MRHKIFLLSFSFLLLFFSPIYSQERTHLAKYSDLWILGENLRTAGEFEKSIEVFNRCLGLSKEIGNEKNELDSLIKLSLLSWNIGRPKDSLDYIQKALLISQSLKLKNIESYCNIAIKIHSLYNEGKYYRDELKEFEKSINLFKQATSLSKDIDIPDYEYKCIRQMSACYYELTDYQEFYRLNKIALNIAQELKNKKDQGICLNNIGLYFWKIDNYSEALKNLEKAIEFAKLTNNLRGETESLNNSGIIYYEMGRYDNALKYFNDALLLNKKYFGPNEISIELNNIGTTYRKIGLLSLNKGDFNKALIYFNDSLSLLKKTNDIKSEIRVLNNIGTVYTDLQKYSDALNYFKLGLDNSEKINDVEAKSLIFNNIGFINSNLGNFEESIKYFQKAIDIALGFKGNQILWEAFFEIANAYKKQNKYLDALKNYKNSIAIIEGARSTIELEHLKASFIGTDKRIETYHNLIDLLVNLNNTTPTKGYDIGAFNYLEKAKARAFLDSLEVSEVSISQGIDFKLSNREAQINSEISKLYKKLLTSESTPEQRNEINEKIKNAEDQLDKLKMEIRMTSPIYADLKYPQIITLQEVQEQLLDGKTAFLAYSVGKDSAYGFAVTKRGLKIFPIPPRSELHKKITEYIKAISDKDNHDFYLGYELFSDLVRPGLDSKIQKMIFFPDDILYYLPFETLLTQKNDNQWLINQYTIAYAPSISSLREIIKRGENNKKNRSKDLLAFGDVLYESANAENIVNAQTDLFQNYYPAQEFKFFQLKYSGIEVQKIASLFKRTKEEVYQKDQASEAELKSLKLDDFKIIHFATHGLIDDKKPTRSSIVLSLNQDSQEDGFVQMREIYNLRMNADLVTLSACQTGLGQFIRGEGIEGLNRALFYAGASSVLMSLWAVNDQASYQLMERFYFHLKTSGSIMAALQKAKLEMIRSRVFSHPYYWAGFVITGNAAKVIFPRKLTRWIPVVVSLCIGGTLFISVRNLRKKKIRLSMAKMCYRVSHD